MEISRRQSTRALEGTRLVNRFGKYRHPGSKDRHRSNRTQEESAGGGGPEAALGLRSFEKDLLRI